MNKYTIKKYKEVYDWFSKNLDLFGDRDFIGSIVPSRVLNHLNFDRLEFKVTKNKYHILRKVCSYTCISLEDITSRCRKREISEARQICMYFLKKYTRLTLNQIGHLVGDRTHDTVIHGIKNIENLSSLDKKFKKYLSKIDELIIENI